MQSDRETRRQLCSLFDMHRGVKMLWMKRGQLIQHDNSAYLLPLPVQPEE